MRRRTLFGVVVGAGVLAGAAAIVVATASAEKETYQGPGLVPTNIGALTSSQTRLEAVPARVAGTMGEFSPEAGGVHALGGGAAFAWLKPGRICYSSTRTAGCLRYEPEPLPKPIDWTVGDPDVVGGGASSRVYGIATDEVRSVTAKLDDGRSVTVRPIGNFYDMELPDGVPPWTSLTLVAELEDGTSYTERV